MATGNPLCDYRTSSLGVIKINQKLVLNSVWRHYQRVVIHLLCLLLQRKGGQKPLCEKPSVLEALLSLNVVIYLWRKSFSLSLCALIFVSFVKVVQNMGSFWWTFLWMSGNMSSSRSSFSVSLWRWSSLSRSSSSLSVSLCCCSLGRALIAVPF